ncbi:MAG TPA: hypothetical protein VJM51_06415, partial [Dehalococcoidia bacterium]|nr:hypothetical protein [Dehalococcoidia bacterium]
MGTDPYRESRVLRVALDEFLKKAAELEKARNILYGEGAASDSKLVDKAVLTIYDAVPTLRTAVDAFEWVIDDIDDEEAPT